MVALGCPYARGGDGGSVAASDVAIRVLRGVASDIVGALGFVL